MQLWFDGAAGRVAFNDSEHYLRCLDAYFARVDAPGCPPTSEETTMQP
jgi:hypothetical protein